MFLFPCRQAVHDLVSLVRCILDDRCERTPLHAWKVLPCSRSHRDKTWSHPIRSQPRHTAHHASTSAKEPPRGVRELSCRLATEAGYSGAATSHIPLTNHPPSRRAGRCGDSLGPLWLHSPNHMASLRLCGRGCCRQKWKKSSCERKLLRAGPAQRLLAGHSGRGSGAWSHPNSALGPPSGPIRPSGAGDLTGFVGVYLSWEACGVDV